VSSKITIKKKRIYKEEDGGVPANHTGAGVANWNPLLGGPKVRKRNVELDGRTKQFRSVVKRIKTRNAKSQERAVKKKFSMWGVTTNPFVKENIKMDESKYLKTKTNSIEDAVITSVNTSPPENPHNTRPILHLPKKKYLESKENSLEQMVINALAEKKEDYNPDTHTSVGSKQKIKPQFNTKTHKLITTPSGDVKIVPKSTPGNAAEALDKGVGSAAYANYTKNITPGEEGDSKVDSRQARVQALAQKMTKKLQQRQAAVIDDAYHFESVEAAINALPAEMVKEEELSTDERKSLPDSAFVFPKERKYPINDIDHARAALSMGAQHATTSEYAKIKAAVKKKYPEIDVGGEKKEEVEVELGRVDIKEYLRKTDDDDMDSKLRKGSFRRHRNIKREKHPIKTGSVEIHPESVDKPEQGKVYALTGKSGTASIARGDSWKKSVVKKPAPVKTAGMATKPLKSVFAKKEEVETETYKPNYGKRPFEPKNPKDHPDGITGPHNYPVDGDEKKKEKTKKEEAELDEANVTGITVSKKMAGITVPPKQVPASQRMDKSKNLMPAPGWKTRKAGKKSGQMTTASYDPTIDKEAELDELSPATKKSYTKKAASDISKRLHDPQDMGPVNRKKMDDRIKGIKRASEEVEVDEDRSPTLVTTRTVLKPSLKGMSKKAKAILRFKDNQAKRIQNKDNRAPGEDLIK